MPPTAAAAADRPRAAAYIVWLGLTNLPFVLCHPSGPLVTHELSRSLAISAVLFMLPGLPLVALLQRAGWLRRWHVSWVLLASLAVLIAGVVSLRVSGQPVAAGQPWNITWLVCNLGWLAVWLTKSPLPELASVPHWRTVGLPAFCSAYLLFFLGATWIVPPQGDHDLDLQGTAHALVTEWKPGYPTARSYYYLAHPPLMHFFVAGSFLYFGELDGVAVYNPRSASALPADTFFDQYSAEPFLLETRTPNLFLSAATIALLALWLVRRTGRRAVGLLLALAYATLPEIFVRSSYGGYYPITQFFALQMLLEAEHWELDTPRSRGRAWLTGALAAWANHKLVLLPIAMGTWRLLSLPLRDGVSHMLRHLFHPVIVGFVIGTFTFWAYGCWVSPLDFWNDHIHHHIVDRITHHNARGLDMDAYQTLSGLWLELLRDTSYLFLPIGLAALGASLLQRRHGERLSVWKQWPGLLATWFALSALAFSAIDWKQTKHLASLLVAVTLGWGVAVARGRISARLTLVLAALIVVINLLALSTLADDFSALVKKPEW
ncbi:MAG: hypothetical protein ABW321_09105 [Polyangiales bacterium]